MLQVYRSNCRGDRSGVSHPFKSESLLDVTAQFHVLCISVLALIKSSHCLQCFLKGLRVLVRVVMSKYSGSQCLPVGWGQCLSLLGRSMSGVQVHFCRAWYLAVFCPMLSAEDDTQPMCKVG